MKKSKYTEIVDRLVTVLKESELPHNDQINVLSETRIQISKAIPKPKSTKSFKPLMRPSGNVMGKQKRQPKED